MDSQIPDDRVRAACAGDHDAFGQLFRDLYPRVHRTVWAILGDEAAAHDVAQEAWIKAWNKRTSYNFQSLYTTWIHRIAVNCALDALRRRRSWGRRLVRAFSGNSDHAPVADFASSDPRPDSTLAARELGDTIEEAVNALPEDQRTVLVLREYEGYSYSEISTALGIAPGTVMSRLHLARQKLQTRLSKDLS